MNRYILTQSDSVQDFEQGLRQIGSYDFVSEHRNSRRLVLMLGQSRAWTTIDGREMPLVLDWKAKIVIPDELRNCVQAEAVVRIARHSLSALGGRWLVDIRSEARVEGYSDLGALVRQDIERGDLPNRLMHARGLHALVQPQIRLIRQRCGADPNFDWRRVRVDVGV